MKRPVIRTFVVFIACFAPLVAPAAVTPNDADAFAGHWAWKGPVDAEKSQMEFTVWIDRKGDAISGTYSVYQYVDGKWQGEDGNQTPFRGALRDGALHIEFDPTAAVPGYEEHVTYKAPDDGRAPSTATMVPKAGALEWTFDGGDPIEGIPDKLTLVRAKK